VSLSRAALEVQAVVVFDSQDAHGGIGHIRGPAERLRSGHAEAARADAHNEPGSEDETWAELQVQRREEPDDSNSLGRCLAE
jgi:hypothetical protein